MYKWNIQKLKSLLNYYRSEQRKCSDPVLLNELENTIQSIHFVIDVYDYNLRAKKTDYFFSTSSFEDVIDDDLRIVEKYGIYCPIIRRFGEYENRLNIKTINVQKISTNYNHIISVSNEFYSSIPGIFSQTYHSISRDFKDTVSFVKLNGKIKEFGQTYPIYNTGISYFEIGISRCVHDYASAIHEFAHGITNKLNCDILLDENKYCFIEVDSLFFELLGLDFIGEKLDIPIETYKVNLDYLRHYLYCADLMCAKLDMYSDLNYKQLYNKGNLKKFLKSQLRFDNLRIKDTLINYMRDNMHYIVSYLTAIELYLIYQEFPNIALDLLYKIIIQKNMSTEEYLKFVNSLGIKPGYNFEKYLSILFDRSKELKNEKSLRYKN